MIPKLHKLINYYYDRTEPTTVLNQYKISFTDTCKLNIQTLGLSENQLILLVGAEFKNHLNYLIYDLEDYPLPVSGKFIVFIDKTEQQLTLRGVSRCTSNQAKLLSWSDVLALYRRATRMSYRKDSEVIFSVPGMIGRVRRLHQEIQGRITKHFTEYDNKHIFVGLSTVTIKDPKELFMKFAHEMSQDTFNTAMEISFNLLQSIQAIEEIHDILICVDNGDMTQNIAQSEIVIAFERSLQYLHKILLLFPDT